MNNDNEDNKSLIDDARNRTADIRQELETASAELHLTNSALDRDLPRSVRQGDVGRALVQNAAIEVKVSEAAEELAIVTELLEQEVAQRARLERKLAASAGRPRG